MRAHRTDQVSLVFALIFLSIAAWWLVAQILDLALPAVGWFLAGALILFGVLGLLGALRSGRSGSPTSADGVAAATESTSTESTSTESVVTGTAEDSPGGGATPRDSQPSTPDLWTHPDND